MTASLGCPCEKTTFPRGYVATRPLVPAERRKASASKGGCLAGGSARRALARGIGSPELSHAPSGAALSEDAGCSRLNSPRSGHDVRYRQDLSRVPRPSQGPPISSAATATVESEPTTRPRAIAQKQHDHQIGPDPRRRPPRAHRRHRSAAAAAGAPGRARHHTRCAGPEASRVEAHRRARTNIGGCAGRRAGKAMRGG